MSLDFDILDPEVVAQKLGCSLTTLEELHRKGELIGVRLGTGGLRYPRESLLRQLNQLSTKFPTGGRVQPMVGYLVGEQAPVGPAIRADRQGTRTVVVNARREPPNLGPCA